MLSISTKLKGATFEFYFSAGNHLTRNIYPYIPNSVPEIKREMMNELGIRNTDELYADIPEEFRLKKELDIPQHGLPESEVKKQVEALLSKNKSCSSMTAFLGAGCWHHYVPAVVKEIGHQSELLTSYTPYQPEISQGMLQALFEYQSMICELAGMDVANSSMYDWATALAEAARMAVRVKGRNEILIPELIHPERFSTLKLYTDPAGIKVTRVKYRTEDGLLDVTDLQNKISDTTAAVYIENPSYLGFIETRAREIASETHSHGALFIAGVDPISLGILKPPGEYGADIVVGEAQPLGNSMNYGGPLLGIMACREDMALIRQMPGRIIGLTTTKDSTRQGFCMALQTREQHIRREKATSNICTNEALCAVASATYIALLGPKGLRELGETITLKTNYAISLLSRISKMKTPLFKSAHFQEFTVNFDRTGLTVQEVNSQLLKQQIHGGKDISKEFPELGQTALYCVNETHTKEEIENLAKSIERIVSGR